MLLKLFRANEWLDSKLSFYLFSLMFILFSNEGLSDRNNMLFVHICLFFYLFFIGASYLVNDISDYEIDRKIGKKKVITEMKFSSVILLLCIASAVGIIPLILYSCNLLGVIISAVIYICGFSYSLKPLRLKERGLFGTVFCSIAQKCIPVLLIILVLRADISLVLMLLMNFFIGMRYILIHQLIDKSNDEASDVSTFSRSHTKAAKVLLYMNVGAEILIMVCMIVYLVSIGKNSFGILLTAALIIYLLLTAVFIKAVDYMLNEKIFETFSFVPFEDMYSFIFPLLICISAGISEPLWFIDAAAICIIQFRMVKVRLSFILEYFKVIFKTKKG